MTQRRPAADRLPTLTEVVEYDGDVIRLRSIAEAQGLDGVGEEPAAAAAAAGAGAGAGAGAASPGQGVEVLPLSDDSALAPASPEAAIDELERGLADMLDQRLGEAFTAIFERAAETARRECQALVLEAVRDLRRQRQQGTDANGRSGKPTDLG